MTSNTVTAEARWPSSPRAILSVLALSGVLSEVLGPDVLIEDRRAGVWRLVTARSSDPDELLEIWLLDSGVFTEAMLTLRASGARKRGATRELKRRLEAFCAQVEDASGADDPPCGHPNERLLRFEYESRARRDLAAVASTLHHDVVWHVPGRNAIAGIYRGKEAVLEYVALRQELSKGTFDIVLHDVLANDEHGIVIASGNATRNGTPWQWRAHGLYRFRDGKIARGRQYFTRDEALEAARLSE